MHLILAVWSLVGHYMAKIAQIRPEAHVYEHLCFIWRFIIFYTVTIHKFGKLNKREQNKEKVKRIFIFCMYKADNVRKSQIRKLPHLRKFRKSN